jgi:hypothetical protein
MRSKSLIMMSGLLIVPASAVSGWTFYTVPGNLTGFEVLP